MTVTSTTHVHRPEPESEKPKRTLLAQAVQAVLMAWATSSSVANGTEPGVESAFSGPSLLARSLAQVQTLAMATEAELSAAGGSSLRGRTPLELIESVERLPWELATPTEENPSPSEAKTDIKWPERFQLNVTQPVHLRSTQSTSQGRVWLIEIEAITGLVNHSLAEPSSSGSTSAQSDATASEDSSSGESDQASGTTQASGRLWRFQRVTLPSDMTLIKALRYRLTESGSYQLELTFHQPVQLTPSLGKDLNRLIVVATPVESGASISDLAVPSNLKPLNAQQPNLNRSGSSTSTQLTPDEPVVQLEQRAATLMKQAKSALIEERNFEAAARLYRQVLAMDPNAQSAAALEYLGLTQERLGKIDMAIVTYRLYLDRYDADSQGDPATITRIRQRLGSLMTATNQPRPALKSLDREPGEVRWNAWGSWSQYLRYDLIQVSGGDMENTAAVLANDLELSVSRRTGSSRDRLRLSAGYYADLGEDEGGGDPQKARISSLYLEHKDRESWLEMARLGRSTSQQDGTLSRYDGLKLEFGVSDEVKLGLVAGYPVASSRDTFADTLSSQRQFIGASAVLKPWESGPELSFYTIEQTHSGLTDRRALGSEVRLYRQGMTLFGLLDYDLHFGELNLALFSASRTLANGTSYTLNIDQRQSPILTTQNALAGQVDDQGVAVTDLDQLQTLYSESDIYQLAKDRTADTQTLSLAASWPLSERLTWANDVSFSQTGATPASGGVAATEASGLHSYFNSRFTRTGWFGTSDINSLGFRTSASNSFQTYGGFVSSRLPLSERWRFYGSLHLDQREWKESGQQQLRMMPGFRIDYRRESMTFEAELDAEWIDTQAGGDSLTGDEQSTGWFFNLGYRYDF